jgi:hypothetical protein
VKSTRLQDNFGYSLLAGYCDKFVFEFVLHGTSDKSFINTIHQSLKFSKQVILNFVVIFINFCLFSRRIQFLIVQ